MGPSAIGTTVIPNPAELTGPGVLTSIVAAAGGHAKFVELLDYKATGAIVFNWGSGEVTGRALISMKAPDLFRLDLELPDGRKSWIMGAYEGVFHENDGATQQIPLHNAVKFAVPFLPMAKIAAASTDSAYQPVLREVFVEDGVECYRLTLKRALPKAIDPVGMRNHTETFDLIVDGKTFLVKRLEGKTFSDKNIGDELPETIIFSDYRQIEGRFIPFQVINKWDGTVIWTLKLDEATFQAALPDSDFKF